MSNPSLSKTFPRVHFRKSGTTQLLASSFAVNLSTRMDPRVSTLQNKVWQRHNDGIQREVPIFKDLVSHHPPVSAYYYISPTNKLVITGELRPKSRFLGNSVSTIMEGESQITLLGKPEDGGKWNGVSDRLPS